MVQLRRTARRGTWSGLPESMLSMLGAPASPAETVRNWRYQFDADAAAGRDPTVGLHFTDSGEKVTACVRHQILVVQDGIADSCDAVVELTLPTSTDPPTSPSCRATPRSGRCAARHRRPMV
jgi:hypothetical protein